MLRKMILVVVLASSMFVSGAGGPKTVNVPHKPSPKILGVVLLRRAALASFASLAQCAGGWGTICNCQVGVWERDGRTLPANPLVIHLYVCAKTAT
jgi:hypothetical protein